MMLIKVPAKMTYSLPIYEKKHLKQTSHTSNRAATTNSYNMEDDNDLDNAYDQDYKNGNDSNTARYDNNSCQ